MGKKLLQGQNTAAPQNVFRNFIKENVSNDFAPIFRCLLHVLRRITKQNLPPRCKWICCLLNLVSLLEDSIINRGQEELALTISFCGALPWFSGRVSCYYADDLHTVRATASDWRVMFIWVYLVYLRNKKPPVIFWTTIEFSTRKYVELKILVWKLFKWSCSPFRNRMAYKRRIYGYKLVVVCPCFVMSLPPLFSVRRAPSSLTTVPPSWSFVNNLSPEAFVFIRFLYGIDRYIQEGLLFVFAGYLFPISFSRI